MRNIKTITYYTDFSHWGADVCTFFIKYYFLLQTIIREQRAVTKEKEVVQKQ